MNRIQAAYERYQRRKDSTLPDKCEFCGLRVSYSARNTPFNEAMGKVAELDRLGLAKYPPRVVQAGNAEMNYQNFFCALGHRKYWGPNNKHKRCPDWQLLLDNELGLQHYLIVHQARKSSRNTFWLRITAIVIAVVGIIITYAVNT